MDKKKKILSWEERIENRADNFLFDFRMWWNSLLLLMAVRFLCHLVEKNRKKGVAYAGDAGSKTK